MNAAPIVLFTYNRLFHTQKTVEALRQCELAQESDLIIFSDGGRNTDDIKKVEKVREFLKEISGFKSISIVERTKNLGLAKSIATGLSDIFSKYYTAIILEDDIVVHPQFLEFINQALEIYKNNKQVFSITGYSHLKPQNNLNNKAYFLKIPSTWGWATWANRWELFSENTAGSEILDNPKQKKLFDFDNSYPYHKMFLKRKKNLIQSWGILWYWSMFKHNGLNLYPTQTLVDHIGWDGTGENGRDYKIPVDKIQNEYYNFIFPEIIEEQIQDRKKVAKKLRYRKLNLLSKFILNKIKNIGWR